jgi:nucleoside-diphosphate-sugar epimerase
VTDLGGRRVLVTGGSGFIGRAVVASLRAAGADVALAGRTRPPDEAAAPWQALDVRSLEDVRDVLHRSRPSVVVHLAAQVAGGRELAQVLPMLEADLIGAVNLLVATSESRVDRLVLAGSLLQEPPADMALPVPPSPYGAAKWAAAGYARMFHALWDAPVVVLRPSMVYGPGQRDVAKIVPYVVTSLLGGVSPRLTSGRWEVDWVYVDDVASAFVSAASRPAVEGATIDIGSGERATVRDVAERLAAIVDNGVRPTFGELPDRPLEPAKVVDVDVARRLLDWSATVSLDEGLRRTVDAARSSGPEGRAGERTG